jgi:hypothetical protein
MAAGRMRVCVHDRGADGHDPDRAGAPHEQASRGAELGVTTFAAAGRSTYARYAAELAANESEHHVLGQTLAGANPPNDLGFAEFEFDRVSQIAAAAQSAGFGFGEKGTAAGRFYDLPRPPMAPRVRISSNRPR